jgi:subtilase family serine protease
MTPRKIALPASLAALALLSLSPLATTQAFALPQHNVSKAIEVSTDLGRVASNQPQTLTIILKTPNQTAFDKVVEDLYDPESPTYHQWLTEAELAKYAPTAAQLEIVKKELVKQGFSVLSTDPLNFSLRVSGTTSTVESAFQTELHNFRYNGKTFQAHTRDAQLTGEAGALVDSVSGIDRHQVHNMLSTVENPITHKPLHTKVVTPSSVATTLAGSITDVGLSPPALSTYTTPGASLPLAVYYGNVYDINSNISVAFSPKQLQAHYGLTSLIKEGYDGTGQTIALVESYGYSAAESDANTAARVFGLPPLTSANFSSIYPEGKPADPTLGELTGWNIEIALDIQSSHSIAPGAKILVVNTNGQDNEDFIASLEYIIAHKLANTVSNSWEIDQDLFAGPAEDNAFNSVLERGAAAGISFQFSSGDSGDGGLGTPIGAPGVPSNCPWATAVGGTSVLNNTAGTGQFATGWGTGLVFIYDGGITDPPTSESEFYAGAGGGESIFFPKPSWQKALPGSGRQVPDVSALADPETGFPILYTTSGVQYAAIYGGTSLASPIFTSVWAIADQYNGKPLGFASPIVAKLKPGQITDVLPTSPVETSDVTGTIFDSSGASFYSQTGLFAGLISESNFTSAIWPIDSTLSIAISFGTDSSLTVTPGWDNVTGFGEPNGLPFIQGVTGKTKGAALTK